VTRECEIEGWHNTIINPQRILTFALHQYVLSVFCC